MVLELKSSTNSLTSCQKKYLPGLRMRPVEVNSPASTNLFLLLSHLLLYSALKVCNSNWSNVCAVEVQFG